MKALVLSGGRGTRLRPLSYRIPKQLIPVANKPILFHGLEELRNIGVTETGIVVNGAGAPIRRAVGDGCEFGMAVTYLPQEEPRGLAHCVMIARDFLGDGDFVMYLGDNVFAGGLGELLADFRRFRPAAQLAVRKVADPSQYGVADVAADGRVTALTEKPAVPASDLAVAGAYFFTPEIHDAVRSIAPSRRNELEITDAIQWLLTTGRDVRARLLRGYWKDTGTLADLLECNKVLLEGITAAAPGAVDRLSTVCGRVLIEAGARVERSVICGPAVIGAGSAVIRSRVGPYTSLGRGCLLEDAGVEYSILLDRASLRRVRSVRGSIIGQACGLRADPDGATPHQQPAGSDSRIGVRA